MNKQKAQVLSLTNYQNAEKFILNYLLYLPPGYEDDKNKKWPLMFFLHGAGERGSNVEFVKRHGLAKEIEQGQNFPFIVVSPQCPLRNWWLHLLPALDSLFYNISSNHQINTNQIYLTGLSMGGYGTWGWSIANPDRFAAIAPVCGGGDPTEVCKIKRVPTWVFHGAKDAVVPISESEKMVKALEKCDGNVKFTVYPEAEHDSWSQTYSNPELFTWFLQHKHNH